MVENQQAPPPALENPLIEKFFHAIFRAYFTTVDQSMTNKNNQSIVAPANPIVNAAAARVRDFTQMNSLVFFGSKPKDDT